MSIFAKIRGAKKAADEHRKSVALKEANVPKIPYKHIPTHAAVDALHVGGGDPTDGYREQIKAQYRRRSEMGPVRSGSDLLLSHAVYRRQSSAVSIGDMSIASVMSIPPMPSVPEDINNPPPMRPLHPSKMGNFRNSYSYNGPLRGRSAFHASASGTSLSKGKSPLSTMTNSINEMPEAFQVEDSLVESSKHSTKSSASSDNGLEIRYSTPGLTDAESSALHTRATSVASRPDVQMSPKTIVADSRRVEDHGRAKSPIRLQPSPFPKQAISPSAFDAKLEGAEAVSTRPVPQSPSLHPMQLVHSVHSPGQRLSTPVSQGPADEQFSEGPTPKQAESEWLPNRAPQRPASATTPRKTNFSRPTLVQEPNSPPRLEMPIEEDNDYGSLDFDFAAEFISFGQNPSHTGTKPQQNVQPQANIGQVQSKQPPPSQAPNAVQRQQVSVGYEPKQSSIPRTKSYNAQMQTSQQSQPIQNATSIPFPTFSPREATPDELPAVRIPYANHYQRRPGTQPPMQMQQQQDYFDFRQRPLEESSDRSRQQAYHQLSSENGSLHARGQEPNYAPPALATSPKMGHVAYTRLVRSTVNYSAQELEAISPMASPMGSPVLAPVTRVASNSMKTITPPTGPLNQRPFLPQKPIPAVTSLTPTRSHESQNFLPPEPPTMDKPKAKDGKPRNFLRKKKKDSAAIKVF